MPRKTLTLTFATLLAALILPPYAWAGPFDTGLYTSKGADNLISSLRVSNQSAGRQRLLETNNTLIDLGSCKFQVNIVSERAVPANYNQSDYLPGKFVSCAFLNDTCGFGTCTSDNIALLPGKY
ncbi:MAG TPA: hypothetical protein VHG27_01815 [Xanthobacteraceae bacterium]|nr:hypothetical protein [Xanthobacteraceae bacterium]